MAAEKFIRLESYSEYPVGEMKERAAAFRADMQRRRSVRQFSSRQVPRGVIEDCILTAASAPSGANIQPWRFVVLEDTPVKQQIRQAAEKEEYEFYHSDKTKQWRDALSDLGTDHQKPFLTDAPYLIIVFAESYGISPDGAKRKHYYVRESVGIAVGILIAAIHNAGLATLPYTPPQPGFLNDCLKRPKNERPFLILPVGYPAKNAKVPDIPKKTLDEITSFI